MGLFTSLSAKPPKTMGRKKERKKKRKCLKFRKESA
jgi:hypothetical protein